MTKIKIIDGKHKCGRFLDLRITSVRKDENDKKSPIFAWMIYGVCKKCKIIVMHAIFLQEDKPVLDLDYIITNKVAKEVKKGNIFEKYMRR